MTTLQAIAIGTGPSFYKWKDTEVQDPPAVLFGCGVVPLYIGGLSYYCIGDSDHAKNLPKKPWHPNCIVYGSTPELVEQADSVLKAHPYPTSYAPSIFYDSSILPHGCSSGGMAVSLACSMYDVVGIVGFDGFQKGFKVEPEVYHDFVRRFYDLIGQWQDKGKRIISLMPSSIFNDVLEVEPAFAET